MPLCLRPELSSQRIDRQGLSQGGAAHASTGGQGRQSVLQLLCHAGDQSAEDYRPPDAVSDRADYHGVWPPTAPGVRANAERALPRLGGSLTPRSAARIEHNGLVVYQRRSATGGQCRDLGRQSEMTQHSLGRGNASPRGGRQARSTGVPLTSDPASGAYPSPSARASAGRSDLLAPRKDQAVYEFVGRAKYDRLLSGIACSRGVLPVRGIEPRSRD